MDDVIEALITEINLRKDYLKQMDSLPVLETIYFGGGTPSLLSSDQLLNIFSAIRKNYIISDNAEITLEANPDDLTVEKLRELKLTPINRLSIGVQSFFDEDLKLMNRAHNADMAKQSVLLSEEAGFKNITIDLIYGVPGMTLERWKKNLDIAFSLPVQHLSCYSLTVEKRTALDKMIREGTISNIDDDQTTSHFIQLISDATKNGFEQYEISNFGKPEYYSRHNSNYWKDNPYIGIGPSAHSYNGISRQWNIASNAAYVLSLRKNEIPSEEEILTVENRYNEYLMTGLRTKWGVNISHIREKFGMTFENDFLLQMQPFIESGDLVVSNGIYVLSNKGKLIADRVAAKGFVV
jgi:oxygen-independent coproporphyrinogen III oxidase